MILHMFGAAADLFSPEVVTPFQSLQHNGTYSMRFAAFWLAEGAATNNRKRDLLLWVKPVLEAIRTSGIPGAAALYINDCCMDPLPEIPPGIGQEVLYDDTAFAVPSLGELSCGEPSYDLMGLDFPASADTINMTGFDFMLEDAFNTGQQQSREWNYEQMGDLIAQSR